jgi:hypothetical protein
MYGWFTTYQGPWNQASVTQHLSEDFKNEIKSLVEQLGLEPVVGSPKHGVVTYGNITVVINRFTFNEFARVGSGDEAYYTPVFRFDINVVAKTGHANPGQSDAKVVYNGPMIVTFGQDYPKSYPFFVLPKYKTNSIASHTHHMYAGGQMCLYGDFGHSDRAWDRDHDTAATAFGPAMNWIFWHEWERPKEGVDADDINRKQS